MLIEAARNRETKVVAGMSVQTNAGVVSLQLAAKSLLFEVAWTGTSPPARRRVGGAGWMSRKGARNPQGARFRRTVRLKPPFSASCAVQKYVLFRIDGK